MTNHSLPSVQVARNQIHCSPGGTTNSIPIVLHHVYSSGYSINQFYQTCRRSRKWGERRRFVGRSRRVTSVAFHNDTLHGLKWCCFSFLHLQYSDDPSCECCHQSGYCYWLAVKLYQKLRPTLLSSIPQIQTSILMSGSVAPSSQHFKANVSSHHLTPAATLISRQYPQYTFPSV